MQREDQTDHGNGPGTNSSESAVNHLSKSVVRENRTPRSVGTGGGQLPPVTRCSGGNSPGLLGIGFADTVERRWGPRIAARGIYRDPVRSSKEPFVKTSGLRWLCFLVLAPIPWAKHVWALPFLSILAPSERYHAERGRRHKTLTD